MSTVLTFVGLIVLWLLACVLVGAGSAWLSFKMGEWFNATYKD